jgi:hypothetical protein
VIRLHDLGTGPDEAVIDFFARTQPERVFYRYDRADFSLTRLGTALELSKRHHSN